jgi:hypothetical protein
MTEFERGKGLLRDPHLGNTMRYIGGCSRLAFRRAQADLRIQKDPERRQTLKRRSR